MLRHLRLARERGSLRAPNHPAQDRALEILMMLDEWDKATARVDEVKRLLATPGVTYERAYSLFPDLLLPPDPFEEARDEDGGFDIDRVDDSKVDWQTPSSPEEDDAISRWIEDREHSGSLTASDFEE